MTDLNELQRAGKIEAAARAAHEANRAYCLHLGDTSQLPWDDAPEWQRSSAITGVKMVAAGSTPEQLHESWMREKEAAGWKYGSTKDPEKKEHPCLVPYSELPLSQQAKDWLFNEVARAILVAFRSIEK